MKKYKLIFINGMPGSGKLTISKMLAEKLDAKVLDNHAINNLVFNIKEFDGEIPKEVFSFFRKVRYQLYDILANLEQTQDYILTGFLSSSNEKAYKATKKLAEDLNAEFIVINLVCSQDEILKRIDNPDRKNNKKLTDPEVYQQVMDDRFLMFPDNSHTIDNTNLSEQRTLDAVLDKLSAKN